MKNALICAALSFLAWSCTTSVGNNKVPENEQTGPDLKVIDDAYHFYTIGDWGRNGEFHQKDLAVQMNKTAYEMEPEIIISTGDNFYPNGVASVDDYYFISSFEQVYDGFFLFCPWYVALGNHDYRGNPQAQIDYSDISQRWNMPDRYFYKDIETDDGASVRFVYLDTNPLNDEYYEETKYAKVHDQDTTAQLQWMEKVLAEEKDWKIVIGHHPLYTGGKRVEDRNFVRDHLEDRLNKYHVNMYLAGHEHDLQHIKPEGSVHHFVSGAGSEVRPTGKIGPTLFAESIQGFLAASITKESIFCQFVDLNGNVIYQYDIKKVSL